MAKRVLQSFHVEGLNVRLKLKLFWCGIENIPFHLRNFWFDSGFGTFPFAPPFFSQQCIMQFPPINAEQGNGQGQLPSLCEFGFKFRLSFGKFGATFL